LLTTGASWSGASWLQRECSRLGFASVLGAAAPSGLWARQQAILHPQGRTPTMPTARQAANLQKRRLSGDEQESSSCKIPADLSNTLMVLASAEYWSQGGIVSKFEL